MIRALVAAVLPEWPELAPEAREEAGTAAAAFVLRAMRLAPLHVRLGLRALGAAFSLFARAASFGRPLNAVNPQKRDSILRNFAGLAFPCAAYLRVVRSLVLLAYCEHPATLRAMGLESTAEKQARFRAARAALRP